MNAKGALTGCLFHKMRLLFAEIFRKMESLRNKKARISAGFREALQR
jgi:hypothetical protein